MIIKNIKSINDKKIISMVKAGFNVVEIANEIGCNVAVVRYRLKLNGVKNISRKFRKGVNDANIINLRNKNYTQVKIADKLGFSQAYISERLQSLINEEKRLERIKKWKYM